MNEKGKRLEALYGKLASLGARHIAMTTGADKGPMEWYTLNGQVIIVQVFARGEGYEVYAPVAGHSNSVQDTLDALDRIAGINPQPTVSNQSKYDRENSTVQLPTAADRGAAKGIIDDALWTAYDMERLATGHA